MATGQLANERSGERSNVSQGDYMLKRRQTLCQIHLKRILPFNADIGNSHSRYIHIYKLSFVFTLLFALCFRSVYLIIFLKKMYKLSKYFFSKKTQKEKEKGEKGPVRESNPGPCAP